MSLPTNLKQIHKIYITSFTSIPCYMEFPVTKAVTYLLHSMKRDVQRKETVAIKMPNIQSKNRCKPDYTNWYS